MKTPKSLIIIQNKPKRTSTLTVKASENKPFQPTNTS
jgi:hypothetical protein